MDNPRSRCDLIMELVRLDCTAWTVWAAWGLCRLDNEHGERLLASLSEVLATLRELPSHCGPAFAWNALACGNARSRAA